MKWMYPAVRVVARIEFGLQSMKCLKLAIQQSQSRSCAVFQGLRQNAAIQPARTSDFTQVETPVEGLVGIVCSILFY